jgi:apolipoprotein N-acyltransferase
LLFACSWIILEQLYFFWEFESPFSSLGIVLGTVPELIQWYQFTGILGGTAWILATNIILSKIIVQFIFQKISLRKISALLLTITLPVIISSFLFHFQSSPKTEERIVHTYCFNNQINQDSLLNLFLLKKKDLTTPDYSVLPELVISLNNQKPSDNVKIQKIRNSLSKRNNRENIIFGADLQAWNNHQMLAVSINHDTLQVRYKEKLVPFGEKIPYSIFNNFSFIKKRLTHPYITPQNGKSQFINYADTFHVSICFETFFENTIKRHVNKNTKVLFFIAREPWNNRHYQNTSLRLTKIQAVIFQKSIVRSSWGGVSCIINNQGEILKSVYNTNTILEEKISTTNGASFFNRCKFNIVFVAAIILLILGIVIKK